MGDITDLMSDELFMKHLDGTDANPKDVQRFLSIVAALKAENERLREALKPMIEGTRWITNEQVDAAREALSGGK